MGTWTGGDESLQEAMARTNEVMAERAGIDERARVLDVGCGYGAAALDLAATHHCEVIGLNISDKELEVAAQRARERGLDDRATFRWADFHDLPVDADAVEVVWSQEAFLHGVDKPGILEECRRVLRPGGRLVISDLLVDGSVPDSEREAIYARVHSPEMWDHHQYVAALGEAGFDVACAEDWSDNVAPTYQAVRDGLVARRGELEDRVPEQQLDDTLDALQLWIDSARADRIAQGFFVGVVR